MKLIGTVKSGVGEGRFFMSLEPYIKQIVAQLHYLPFKGTLNLEVDRKEAQQFIEQISGFTIEGFTMGQKTFGKVDVYPCTFQKIPCAIIVPEFTRYELSTVELISEKFLRRDCSLNDGDEVSLEL